MYHLSLKGAGMTRISKKDQLKNSPRKTKKAAVKTGSLKDNLPKGYREHSNILNSKTHYIPKVSHV